MTISHLTVENVLQATLSDGVLKLTKNNPQSAYGISVDMWKALTAALEFARDDSSVRAVTIDAAGKGFHRGAIMVNELRESLEQLTTADFRDLVQRGQALGRLTASLPKPVIGIAKAGALGGGLEMLMRCDFVYSTHQASFSFPEVTLGFVAAWGGTQWGTRAIAWRRAQELLLIGEAISGKEAEEINLITRSFDGEDHMYQYVETLLQKLKYCSPASFAETKKCLAATWSGPLELGERVELEAEADAMATGDFIKGLKAWANGQRYNYADGKAE